jgi:hypothetical protein
MITDQLANLIPTRNRPAILRKTLDKLRARGFGEHPLLLYSSEVELDGQVKENSLWISPKFHPLGGASPMHPEAIHRMRLG